MRHERVVGKDGRISLREKQRHALLLDRVKGRMDNWVKIYKELKSEEEKNSKILKFTRTLLHFLKCLAQ